MLIFKENLKFIFTHIIDECWKAAVNAERLNSARQRSEEKESENDEESEEGDFESLSAIISKNLMRNKVKQSKRSKSSIHSSSDLPAQEYKKFRNSQHIGIQSSDKDLYISSVENLHKINSKDFVKLLQPRPRSKDLSERINSFDIEKKETSRKASDLNISHVNITETPTKLERRETRVIRAINLHEKGNSKLKTTLNDPRIIYTNKNLRDLSKGTNGSNKREISKYKHKKHNNSFKNKISERLHQMNQKFKATSKRLISNRIRFERPSRPRVEAKPPKKFQLHKFVLKGPQYKLSSLSKDKKRDQVITKG